MRKIYKKGIVKLEGKHTHDIQNIYSTFIQAT